MNIKHLKIGKKSPEEINVVIEIPKGSQNKYEYDEKADVIKLDRVLHSSLFYPADYGFIPETRSEDGDHLDVLVCSTTTFFPGAVIPVKPIGLLKMVDGGELDLKILSIVKGDPRLAHINSLKDAGEHLLKEIIHFFSEYKKLENKEVKVEGWHDKETAWKEIKKSHAKYIKEKKKK